MTFIVLTFLGSSSLRAGQVQTDTHIYSTCRIKNAVLAVNRATGHQTLIPVGSLPVSLVIHGEFGYVANNGSNDVTVIDLKTHSVTQTFPVGKSPTFLTIYRNMGYILNDLSRSLSIFDPLSCTETYIIGIGHCPDSIAFFENTGYIVNEEEHYVTLLNLDTVTIFSRIETNAHPQSMKIYGEMGYTDHWESSTISVINLKTNRIIHTFNASFTGEINFTDSHVYAGRGKLRPHFPTKDILRTFIQKNQLGDFVALKPDVFNLGEIEPRPYLKDATLFDSLPVYIMMINLALFINDPESVLNLLITMKYPQRVLRGKTGLMTLRYDIYAALFQALWTDDFEKATRMLTKLIQLKDPIITPLATFSFKKSDDKG